MPIEITCPICGRLFKGKPNEGRVYCSRPCMAKGYAQRLTGSANPHYRGNDKQLCKNCGKTFSRAVSRKFCGNRCAGVSNYRSNDGFKSGRVGRKYPNRKKTLVSCFHCSKEFPKNKDQKFCSKACLYLHYRSLWPRCSRCGGELAYRYSTDCPKCRGAAIADRQRGSRSHRWKGGKTSEAMRVRNSAEYAAWRTAVFKRDDFTCQDCAEVGGRLTAHHIRPFSRHPELRLSIDNGITLCRACHVKTINSEHRHIARFERIIAMKSTQEEPRS